MTYQTEFPDFRDMPSDIPAEWSDTSWRNDACPSFVFMSAGHGDSNYQRAVVWIAESNPTEREFPNSKRFLVSYYEGESDCVDVLVSDDWPEVRRYIETRRKLGASCTKAVGYNPFLDDPTSDPWAIAESLYVTRRLALLETAP